jgi:hypothetical protein
MESFDPAHSTLVFRSVTVCPRCNGVHIRAIGVDAESTLEWRACSECSFLWGLPRGWTPDDGPLLSRTHHGAARW